MEKNSPSSSGFLQKCYNTLTYLFPSAVAPSAASPPAIPSLPPVKLVLVRVEEHRQIDIEAAIHLGRSDLIPQFTQLGVNFNAIGANGETLLYMAANLDQVGCALALIRGGAKLDLNIVKARFENNQTYLHRAAQLGNLDWVKVLISAELNIHAPDEMNRTPIMIANDACHVNVVRLLEYHGARLSLSTSYTPLLKAHAVSSNEQIDGDLLEENKSDYFYDLALEDKSDSVKNSMGSGNF